MSTKKKGHVKLPVNKKQRLLEIGTETEEINMTKEKTKLVMDKSQPIFVGIDVHKKKWSICLIHCRVVIGRVSIAADFEAFKRYLKRYEGFKIYSVYEAGFSGFHLHHQLCSIGIDNIITPPNKLPVVSGDKVKTDKRDSLKLAQYLSCGLLKAIYIPTDEQINYRQIMRTRDRLKKKRIRIISQIKMLLIQFGICFDKKNITQCTKGYITNLQLPSMIKMDAKIHLDQLEFIENQMKELKKEMKKVTESSQCPNAYKIIKSAPGIGDIIALALTYEIGDWSRFNNEKQVSAYFGLTPSEYSSGENVHRGRITGQGNTMLRALLIQAAWRWTAGGELETNTLRG
jgi:transposase